HQMHAMCWSRMAFRPSQDLTSVPPRIIRKACNRSLLIANLLNESCLPGEGEGRRGNSESQVLVRFAPRCVTIRPIEVHVLTTPQKARCALYIAGPLLF